MGANTAEEDIFFIGGFNGIAVAEDYLTTFINTDNRYVKLLNNSFGTYHPKTKAFRRRFCN